jgi:hypothetical protein
MKQFYSLFLMIAFLGFSYPLLADDTPGPTRSAGGLFLEPSLFYEQGTAQVDLGGFAQPSGELKGAGVGLRFGGHINDVVFLALDGSYSKPKFTDKNSIHNYDADISSWLVGATVGAQTPYYGIRVWGSYIPFGMAKLEGSSEDSPTVRWKDPQIWKFGAGVYVWYVSINLEYMTGKYTKAEVLNTGFLNGDYSAGDTRRNSWLLSVSFPLAL